MLSGFFWNHVSSFPHGKASQLFLGTRGGFGAAPKIPQGTPIPRSLGFLGMAAPGGDPRDFGEFGEPVPPVLPLDGRIWPGSPGAPGSQ
uniref:Uncharacterized protein n=1 Tax=Zonotrichia albicollis TaxID=44394 RepID=A0A8D2QE84_ZONAL